MAAAKAEVNRLATIFVREVANGFVIEDVSERTLGSIVDADRVFVAETTEDVGSIVSYIIGQRG